MIRVSMYLGLIVTLPILLYHLYRFIAPAVVNYHKKARYVIVGVTISFILAIVGIIFAYLVSLPSAIHFLTNIHIGGVSPMLTVDSYLSFIVAYLLAGALLFQLPLIMVTIDSIKPTPPGQWGKYQRHVIVGALILGMLITPTPNIIDQVLIALPMVAMYQVGIGIIYFRHRSKRSKRSEAATGRAKSTREFSARVEQESRVPVLATSLSAVDSARKVSPRPQRQSMEFVSRPRTQPAPHNQPAGPARVAPRRSIDGISIMRAA